MSAEVRVPGGFRFAATTAGIKASGKPDLALIEAPDGATAAAVFTRNRVVAAPVIIGRDHLKSSGGKLRAIVVNAGNANCATGKQGIAVCEKSCKALAAALETKSKHILPSSTGVIGVPLPVEKLVNGIRSLLEARGDSPDHAMAFAQAIMTTDTRPKIATTQLRLGDKTATLLGIAKGAGMIHPNMATMLAYVITDVAASAKDLNQLLRQTADRTFNRISIDGDTSTNDTLSLLASGASQLSLSNRRVKHLFTAALFEVCADLSEQIIADGEGVKHVVRLRIEGAKSEREAEQIAKTIAHSPLVKTAWAGSDPNWGRILAAIGRSGVELDPSRIDIYFGDIQVCRRGAAHPFSEAAAHAYLSQPRITVRINLGEGKRSIVFLTCDLTAEYVHINAEYTT
jgi:glutamate N-acetyltransferase/amino-acid N-acetyltransferase